MSNAFRAAFPLRPSRIATLVALACTCNANVFAQSKDIHATELAPVVVTGNPLGSGLFDLASPVSVMTQKEISNRSASTLGDLLTGIPGVSATNFGPNASRPVIRGLDADRIRIMQNGVGISDVSALSPDHAVPIDPFIIDQVEVVRGPAALLYGGSAVGGVVNAIDNRIPQEAITGATGRAEVRSGGAERQSSGAAVLEVGNGMLSLHADAYQRSSENLKVPGFTRSSRLRQQSPQANEPQGELRNSSAKSDGGALGASLAFQNGYLGLSYATHNADYGTVAEENVRIRMKSDRLDLAGEVRDLDGFFKKVKVRFAKTDYEHREIDAGQIASTFLNNGEEGMIEATHAKIGPLSGVVGLQFNRNSVKVIGDEALLPDIRTRSQAAYIYEELPLNRLKLSFGGRVESTDVQSAGGGPDDPNLAPGTPRFGPAQSRTFNPRSGAVGAVYTLTDRWSVASNVSHTERAPTYNELFANGPHPATGQYEVGNSALKVERSNGIDLQLRWRNGPHSMSVSAYQTRFKNFVNLFSTGNNRDEDGTINAAGELAEAEIRAVPARFNGLEAEGKFHVYEGTGDLDLRLRADVVRATNTQTGVALPRISPYHLGAGLDYRLGNLGARLDAVYGGKQNRVAANELATDDYLQLNAQVSYRLRTSMPNAELFVKGNNLLNEEIRLHTSVLKDRAPMGRRSIMLGFRGNF